MGCRPNLLNGTTDIPQVVPLKKRKTTDVLPELEQEFENTFWPSVPNKLGHGVAREAFVKARKKTSLAEIMAGMPNYVAYEGARRNQADYRPLHPATWLNQERWRDGPPPAGAQRLQTAVGSGTDYSKLVQGDEHETG